MAACSRGKCFTVSSKRRETVKIPSMLRSPSLLDAQKPNSKLFTALYLVSSSLPADIGVLQFDIISRDMSVVEKEQNPWTWFEVSILRPWRNDCAGVVDFSPLTAAENLKPRPEAFEASIDEMGYDLEEIPMRETGEDTDISIEPVKSLPLVKNSQMWGWQHHCVTWTRNGSHQDGSAFVSLLQEGDRVALWACSDSALRVNYVKEAQIALSTAKLGSNIGSGPADHDDDRPPQSYSQDGRGSSESHIDDRVEPLAVLTMKATDIDNSIPRYWITKVQGDRVEAFGEGGAMTEAEEFVTYRVSVTIESQIREQWKMLGNLPAENDKERIQLLFKLGSLYGASHQRTGEMQELEVSIICYDEILELLSENDPLRGYALSGLGAACFLRYRRSGDMSDLDSSTQYQQEALGLTTKDDKERVDQLANLAQLYTFRYRQTGEATELDLAIRNFQEALAITIHDDPETSRFPWALGYLLMTRYDRNGETTDLDDSIQYFRQAVYLAAEDEPSQTVRLENLASAYEVKYRITGEMEYLDHCIQYFQEALFTAPDDDTRLATRYWNVAAVYWSRYGATKARTDFEIFLKYVQKSLDVAPEQSRGHPLPLLMLHVGSQMSANQQNLDVRYIDQYIRYVEEAVSKTSNNEIGANGSQTLGRLYLIKNSVTGEMGDLGMAAQHLQDTLANLPVNHPGRASALHDLGDVHGRRYSKSRRLEDLDFSVQYYQECVDATRVDDPDRGARLLASGLARKRRHRKTGMIEDLETVNQHLQQTLAGSFPPSTRLEAGVHLLRLAAKRQDWFLAHQVASTAVSLIPLLAPRSFETSDKQLLLMDIVGLASDAAAVALLEGKSPYEALQLLEVGRGVIINSLGDMHADVSDLFAKHPRLAKKYVKLRDQLTSPTAPNGGTQVDRAGATPVDATRAEQRNKADKKLQEIIQIIRDQPGFERFLLAPSEGEMKEAARSGPIVVINVSRYRCDAIIVEKDDIRVVRLRRLSAKDLMSKAQMLARQEILDTELLEWLWEAIAAPVLDALNLMGDAGSGWPRVWWVPTGLLVKMPIHAAGDHVRGSFETVVDRTISSYSTSVKALVRAHQQSAEEPAEPHKLQKMVVVGMPVLPYAVHEVEMLESLCIAPGLHVYKPQPCEKDVLAALKECDVFHFAGHGKTDPVNPLKSALLLKDELLTVESLFEIDLHDRKPLVAYLSACGTGQVKHERLIDESLHLISAYQLAGFRNVIGTLWEVDDQTCMDAARITYEWMKKNHICNGSVSEGVHHATRELREKWIAENSGRMTVRQGTMPDETASLPSSNQAQSPQGNVREPRDMVPCDSTPLCWVPYVHFGI